MIQGAHKEAGKSVRIREATMQRRGRRGTPLQLFRMRPTDDWGMRQGTDQDLSG